MPKVPPIEGVGELKEFDIMIRCPDDKTRVYTVKLSDKMSTLRKRAVFQHEKEMDKRFKPSDYSFFNAMGKPLRGSQAAKSALIQPGQTLRLNKPMPGSGPG